MGINLKLSSSASGTRNITFNPVVVATESHVFGMDPSDPSQYLVPGNGVPAVSTAGFLNSFGLYNFRCYNLDDFGATGAAVKAANGGRRYVWVWSADHPNFSYSWRGGEGTCVGFSSQPWDFPRKGDEIIPLFNGFQTPNHTVSGGYNSYEFPTVGYNPDDPDGLPIYLWIETGPNHFTALWRSSDFRNFTVKELSHFNSGGNRFSSFVTYYKRNGPNDFTTIALITEGDLPQPSGRVVPGIWTSTDGIEYSTNYLKIDGINSFDSSDGSNYNNIGHIFDVGAKRYMLAREDATGVGNNQYCSIIEIDPTTFARVGSYKMRIASGWGNANFPGPAYLQACSGYEEDGVLYALPLYGFPSDVNTVAGQAGRGGAPYSLDGGLDQQYVDKIVVRVNDAAARLAAPVGFSLSCASGTVTAGWKDALPQNTYRLYYGTNATTQATLVGDYTGVTSANVNGLAQGRYWFKLVTLDNGTERKDRVLSVYVSSSGVRTNDHFERVADDGGDVATINRPYVDRFYSMLDTVGIENILELWTCPAMGISATGAPGGFLKIYDAGTTRLPRSEDFKATTSSTTYDATGINGGPCWVNANNNSFGYWGNSKRGNTIQQKRQITIIVAYERTQTSEDFTFCGTGPIFGNSLAGNAILSLKHTAGSPGNIEFSLSDETSTKTASVAASGSGLQIAVATYDGTDMLAYSGSIAGSAVSTLDPNPDFGKSTASNVKAFVVGSLAGSRNTQPNGDGTAADSINVSGFGFKRISPFLGSGSVHCYNLRAYTAADDMKFNENNAKGKIQVFGVLEGAADTAQIADIVSFLNSAVDW